METLDYPAAQTKLMAMLGERIDCGVSGVDSPTVAYLDGVLKAGGEVYGGAAMGYDPNVVPA